MLMLNQKRFRSWIWLSIFKRNKPLNSIFIPPRGKYMIFLPFMAIGITLQVLFYSYEFSSILWKELQLIQNILIDWLAKHLPQEGTGYNRSLTYQHEQRSVRLDGTTNKEDNSCCWCSTQRNHFPFGNMF